MLTEAEPLSTCHSMTIKHICEIDFMTRFGLAGKVWPESYPRATVNQKYDWPLFQTEVPVLVFKERALWVSFGKTVIIICSRYSAYSDLMWKHSTGDQGFFNLSNFMDIVLILLF